MTRNQLSQAAEHLGIPVAGRDAKADIASKIVGLLPPDAAIETPATLERRLDQAGLRKLAVGLGIPGVPTSGPKERVSSLICALQVQRHLGIDPAFNTADSAAAPAHPAPAGPEKTGDSAELADALGAGCLGLLFFGGLLWGLIWLVGSCTGFLQDAANNPPTDRGPAPSRSDASVSSNDAAFLGVMRTAFPGLVDDDEGLIEVGQTVCDSFRVGDSLEEVRLTFADIGREIGLSSDRAVEFSGTVIGAATAAYCPEYP